jgi:hypothetical protein
MRKIILNFIQTRHPNLLLGYFKLSQQLNSTELERIRKEAVVAESR